LLLTLAFDGASFSGFAPQARVPTVGSALDSAIRQMDPEAGPLRVASRTDAGVHARGQVASFDSSTRISCRGWLLGLSGHLPPQIAIQRVARVPAGYNPSRRARSKVYSYWLLRGTLRDPFLQGRAWRVHDTLDLGLMRAECAALLGSHDFAAFRGSADFRKTTVRTLSEASLEPHASLERCLVFRVRGDRFLYNMVRIIVGTLVDVGRGRVAPGAVRRAIASKQRTDLGMTAPPDGLYLECVELDDRGSDEWPYQSRPGGEATQPGPGQGPALADDLPFRA
jgi:tRNA pseudouridine38-40 synthase